MVDPNFFSSAKKSKESQLLVTGPDTSNASEIGKET